MSQISEDIKRLFENFESIDHERFNEICHELREKYGDSICIKEVGSFDSPGYDMSAWAFAYVEDGKPKIYGIELESY